MKPNQKGRYNGRYNNNTNRGSRPQVIFRNTSLESTGPCGKLRGTALQLFEKYQAAAKDALIQNDDILAETCLQYADHYMHLQNIAIANEQAFRPQGMQGGSVSHRPVYDAVGGNVSAGSSGEMNHAERVEPADGVRGETVEAERDVCDVDIPSDGALKVLDLSVPVADMAANHQGNVERSVQPAHRRRGRPARDKKAIENTVSEE